MIIVFGECLEESEEQEGDIQPDRNTPNRSIGALRYLRKYGQAAVAKDHQKRKQWYGRNRRQYLNFGRKRQRSKEAGTGSENERLRPFIRGKSGRRHKQTA